MEHSPRRRDCVLFQNFARRTTLDRLTGDKDGLENLSESDFPFFFLFFLTRRLPARFQQATYDAMMAKGGERKRDERKGEKERGRTDRWRGMEGGEEAKDSATQALRKGRMERLRDRRRERWREGRRKYQTDNVGQREVIENIWVRS